MMRPTQITDSLVADLAREADADRRSIWRALAGLPVRGRAGRRISRVLAERGLVAPGVHSDGEFLASDAARRAPAYHHESRDTGKS